VDVLKSLRATLHYYEHVANRDTPNRLSVIVTQTQKLRKILARIENELESESRAGIQSFLLGGLNHGFSYSSPKREREGSACAAIRRPRTERT
jgi:hypothetical protein